MKEKNISSKIIIILFTIIIVILGGYICYKERNATKEIINNNEIKEESKDKQNDNDKTSQYEIIKGTYQYNGEPYNIEDEKHYPVAAIKLNENGTYVYERVVTDVPSGHMGNYIIDGNTIKLNHLFETGSDAGLDVINNSTIITINDDNTLTMSDSNIEVLQNMKMTKIGEDAWSPIPSSDFDFALENYDIENNINNNSN